MRFALHVQNMVQTDYRETSDLLSFQLFSYLFLLGVLPAFVVYTLEIESVPWKKAALRELRDAVTLLLIISGVVIPCSKLYTSFFREHKSLRYYTNPTYYIYSVYKYIHQTFNSTTVIASPLGEDARIPATDNDRELVILVVGEAARSDRFSLNGYRRETNPLLQKEDVISFANMSSCRTSTAYSVPCMFSILPRDEYSDSKGAASENLLDVLQHGEVNVLCGIITLIQREWLFGCLTRTISKRISIRSVILSVGMRGCWSVCRSI